MDFETMGKRLADGHYTTIQQLKADFILICKNAIVYNEVGAISSEGVARDAAEPTVHEIL